MTSDWNLANEMTALRENGAASGPGVLATFAYDDLGRRTGLARGNGAGTTYAYDAASRLTSLAHDLAGASQDQTYAFTYNGAFQALTRNGSNAAYDWAPLANGTTASPANGLNQYASVGGAALTYDGRGNLTSDSSRAFAYDVYNRLTGVSGSAALTLAYDPAGRLTQTIAGAATTRFLYDPGSGSGAGGLSIIGEYDGSGALLRRHVHGPAVDEPLVSYDGAGTTNRAWLIADALGSVIASTNASAAATTINTYDEFGRPGAGNVGLFGFTGQMNLAAAGLMHYRARAYDPALGRFLQADPILFGGGMNLYAYVANDPVNAIDPLGLQAWQDDDDDEIVVPGSRLPDWGFSGTSFIEFFDYGPGWFARAPGLVDEDRPGPAEEEITVTAPRPRRDPFRIPPHWLRLTPWIAFVGALTYSSGLGDSDYQCTSPGSPTEDDCGPSASIGPTEDPEEREARQRCFDRCYPILERWQPPGSDRNERQFHICVRQCLREYGYDY